MRKNNNHLLLLILFSFCFLSLQSQKVHFSTLQKVAINFYASKGGYNPATLEFSAFYPVQDKKGDTLLCIFNFKNKGFIVLNTDKRLLPVAGYSFTTPYVPDSSMNYWINSFKAQANRTDSSYIESEEAKKAWEKYSSDKLLPELKAGTTVGPLVKSKWGQGSLFNTHCPVDSAGPSYHVMVGCVAVAMAQVMKYHQYPPRGRDSNSYTYYPYGTLSAYFDTEYKWQEMPDIVNGTYPELTRFLYHCGVSVNMMYGPDASGAYSSNAANSLIKYFQYSENATIQKLQYYKLTDWTALLKEEIDAGRPMYYAGDPPDGSSGHAFVCDGYQDYYFHFNWGWAGSKDGYFYVTSLTPDQYNFNEDQEAIIGLEPPTSFKGFDTTACKLLLNDSTYSENNFSGKRNVNTYGSFNKNMTGKEMIYRINPNDSGDITIKIKGSTKLKLFLFDTLQPGKAIAYGDTMISLQHMKPGTYYIVVDGMYYYSGSFTIKTNYNYIIPPDNPSFSLTTSAKDTCFPFDSTVIITSEIKNTGNCIIDSLLLKHYLSLSPKSEDIIIALSSKTIDSIEINSSLKFYDSLIIPSNYDSGYFFIISVLSLNDYALTDTSIHVFFIQKDEKSPSPPTPPTPPEGLFELCNNKSIQFFPVPTSEILYFQSVFPVSSIQLYNDVGKMIINTEIKSNYIDVSALAPGFYYMIATDVNNNKYTGKILIER